MICAARVDGTFQVESRAQQAMLVRTKPRTFFDLVIQVAVVRPGPIVGGMVNPYLTRREGHEPVTYEGPEVEKILACMLGVPIFQEQVMNLTISCAGFTANEADQLRRAMGSFEKRGELEKFTGKLISGTLGRGYASEFAQSITRFSQAFASHSFPMSHSASFVLLTYASCWIKCHEPAILLCALSTIKSHT